MNKILKNYAFKSFQVLIILNKNQIKKSFLRDFKHKVLKFNTHNQYKIN